MKRIEVKMNINEQIELVELALEQLVNSKIKRHSQGVAKEASKLAKHYHEDEKKAYLAGLAHDCVKCFLPKRLLEMAKEYNIQLDEVTSEEPGLLHAKVGAHYLKNELKIEDDQIFYAILYHTTGNVRMDNFAKILYLADYIEPNRKNFKGMSQLRSLIYQNLNYAVLFGLNLSLDYLIKHQKLIHPDSVQTRNYLLLS